MGEFSNRDALTVPSLLCGAMIFIGVVTARASGVDGSDLVVPYFSAALSITFLCTLISIFVAVARLAPQRADRPLQQAFGKFRQRAPLLILPALITPVFLVAFTTSKTAIPFLVGYRWDSFWADVDLLIFGDDAWRLTHRLFGGASLPFWQWFYTVAWGFVLIFTKALVPLFAPPKRVAIFFTAMLGTWLLGGWLIA